MLLATCTRTKRIGTVIAAALFGVAWTARGEIVHLIDGTEVEGNLRKVDDGWQVTDAQGKTRLIHADHVAFIEARPRSNAGSAESHLASLRRSVENSTDIPQILGRYKNFIAQNPGDPILPQARQDMQIWQERQDRGLVKLGERWMTPVEKADLLARSDAAAGQAMQLLKQSRLHEASVLLDQIITDNPQNAAAYYLRGVLLCRQDQFSTARKSFESVIAILPDHAPSLNNIAVIHWRQNEPAVALGFYDHALAAATGLRDILDNAAEALDALPQEYRDAPVTRKMVRHFNEQDSAMQKLMASAGLYRWGSAWVSSGDLEKLTDAERQIKAKLDQLSADFDAVTARIARIDETIVSDRQLAKRMELDSYGRDPATGVAVRFPLPGAYYDLLHEIRALQSEREDRRRQQEIMRQQAKAVQQTIPMPKFTGIQRIIDVEGAPISAAVLAGWAAPPPPAGAALPVAPTPATQPAVTPSTAPSTGAAPVSPLPRHTYVPPEKPSIMDASP